MDNTQSSKKCHILEDLPPELRLRIYEHLFCEDYQSSLLIRSASKIEPIAPAKAPIALFKTCKIVYSEASPVLYSRTTFRVQIYPVDGFSSHGSSARLGSITPFLSRIQHLEIRCCVMFQNLIEPALRLLKTFADALEQAGTDIKTLDVRSKLFPGVTEIRMRLCQDKLEPLNRFVGLYPERKSLFKRMLDLANPSDLPDDGPFRV